MFVVQVLVPVQVGAAAGQGKGATNSLEKKQR